MSLSNYLKTALALALLLPLLASAQDEGFITGTDVRLRTGPSLSASTVGLMEIGTPVKIIGKSAQKTVVNGQEHHWYQVELYDRFDTGMDPFQSGVGKAVAEGWVYGQFLSIQDVTIQAWREIRGNPTPFPKALHPLTRARWRPTYLNYGCEIGEDQYDFSPSGGMRMEEAGYTDDLYSLEKANSVSASVWQLTFRHLGGYSESDPYLRVPFPAEKKSVHLEVGKDFDQITVNGDVYYNANVTMYKIVTASKLKLRTSDIDVFPGPSASMLELPVGIMLNHGDWLVTHQCLTHDTIIDGKEGRWVHADPIGKDFHDLGIVFSGFLRNPTLEDFLESSRRDSFLASLLNGKAYEKWISEDGNSTLGIHPGYALLELDKEFTLLITPSKPPVTVSSGGMMFKCSVVVQDHSRGGKWFPKYQHTLQLSPGSDGQSLTTMWDWVLDSPFPREEWAITQWKKM